MLRSSRWISRKWKRSGRTTTELNASSRAGSYCWAGKKCATDGREFSRIPSAFKWRSAAFGCASKATSDGSLAARVSRRRSRTVSMKQPCRTQTSFSSVTAAGSSWLTMPRRFPLRRDRRFNEPSEARRGFAAAPHRKVFTMKVCALALLMFLAVLPVAAQDTDSQSAAVASAKQVFQQIVAGQFDTVEARYNDSMSAALHPGTLASAWAKLLESAGSFDSVTSANATKSQTFDVVVLVCKFEKGLID